MISSKAKKVITRDAEGKENGFLVELFKYGDKTVSYLTAAKPGAFKGYHLHRIRAARYICIKGKMLITTYTYKVDKWVKEETILHPMDRMEIPTNTATGLENIGNEEAWLINYPDPAYDPTLSGEQVEYTKTELEEGIRK